MFKLLQFLRRSSDTGKSINSEDKVIKKVVGSSNNDNVGNLKDSKRATQRDEKADSDSGSSLQMKQSRDATPERMMVLEGIDGEVSLPGIDTSKDSVNVSVKDIFILRSKTMNSNNVDASNGSDNPSLVHNVAFLGLPDSGKSTLVKQLNRWFGEGFNESGVEIYKSWCVSTVVQLVNRAITLMGLKKILLSTPGNDYTAERLRKIDDSLSAKIALYPEESREISDIIPPLISDPAFLDAMDSLPIDNLRYFVDNATRIIQPEYIPNPQDIIMCRVPTIHTEDSYIPISSAEGLKIIDLGGFRFQRNSWKELTDINAIVFVHALSSYDTRYEEDYSTTTFAESLNAFSYLLSLYPTTKVILLFTKKDIFTQKLRTRPFRATFPEAKGNDYQSAVNYIIEQFMLRNKESTRVFHYYILNSVNDEQVKANLKLLTQLVRSNDDDDN